MAKYGSPDISISYGGTEMKAHVRGMNAVRVESLLEESHAMGDAWAASLASGLRQMGDLELEGLYDDTATTGPDAKWATVASGPSQATVTLIITWGGSKTTTVETLVMAYERQGNVGELTKYKAILRPTGTVTEA